MSAGPNLVEEQDRAISSLFVEPEPEPEVELISSAAVLNGDTSEAARYVSQAIKHGTANLIGNIASRPLLLRYGELRLPVTVEDCTLGQSYVVSPHSNYVLYARDEIDILDLRLGRTVALGVLGLLDALLKGLEINRTVHLNNWMLSTNLHGDWNGEGLAKMRAHLTEEFPDLMPVIRSLDPWSCPQLLDAVKRDGWVLMPARQIWVTDDLKRDWKKRNNTQNDRRALKKSGFTVDEPQSIDTADAERIAQLYRALYVERYSAINPVFTADFVKVAAQSGLLRFKLVRCEKGEIVAVCALREAGSIATVPFLGYDLTRPQSEGLYRIACYIATHDAMEAGLRFNGSAGAAEFKTRRGAYGQIEYMAVYVDHLPFKRRVGVKGLAAILRSVLTPMLKSQSW